MNHNFLQAYYLKSVMFEVEALRTELMKSKHDESKLKQEKDEALGDNLSNREIEIDGKNISPYALRRDSQPGLRNILLKGQMLHLSDVNGIIFLCCPV